MTVDGQHIKGTLASADQESNIVLTSAQEMLYGEDGAEMIDLGFCLLRGDNIVSVGLVDTLAEAAQDMKKMRSPSFPEIRNKPL